MFWLWRSFGIDVSALTFLVSAIWLWRSGFDDIGFSGSALALRFWRRGFGGFGFGDLVSTIRFRRFSVVAIRF